MPQEFADDALILTVAQLSQKYNMSEKAIINRIKKLNIDYGDRRAERFKQRVKEFVGDEYTVIGEYIDCNTQVLIKHNKCGCEWNVTPHNFFSHNSRCPVCSGYNSKGDQIVRRYLSEKEYTYIEQYTYADCCWKNPAYPLRFDFAVIIDNEVKCLIEFDGMQHFKSIKLFGGEKYFEEIKIRDSIKDEYCKKHGIQLIRIPYTQLNKIYSILDKKISL